MAKKAIAYIEVEGLEEPLSPFHQVHISQTLFAHHEFEVFLPISVIEGSSGNILGKSKDLIGKQIKINIESQQLTDTVSQLFIGVITNLGFSRSHGADSHLILKGKSPTIAMEDGKHCHTFSENNLADIIQETMGHYPSNLLPFQIHETESDVLPFIMQYQETNFDFLARMCDRMGAWMYYDGEEMQFGSQGTTDPTSLTLGSDLHSFDLSLEMAPLNANYHAYQYLDNETYEGTGSQARVSDLDNNYGKVVYDSSEQFFNDSALSQARLGFASQSELDQFVGRRRNQQASRMVVLHGNSENIAVRIGSTVEILGSRSDNRSQGMENYGNFLVIRTSHKIYGDGNYQNMFEAIPEESAVPPVNPKVSIPQVQVQPAKVVENHDPQGLARLRVQFYWQSGNQLTPWIRTLSTAGGADGGFFVMPEIGDEVMIGFEYDDPDRPVVLGSLYHGNAKPSDSYQNGDNDIKAIKTKSGNEITIIDTAGSEEIRISTGDGNNSLSLTMAGGGTINFASGTEMTVSSTTINIQASDTLNLEANDINITAGNNLTVTAGADTTLDAGANVGMTAAANFTLDAGANLEESAGANLSLSAGANGDWATGANLNLDAGANFQANGGVNADINAGANAKLAGGAMADVEGGASAKVSGATVNIEGQAMTNVTGGIVKLN